MRRQNILQKLRGLAPNLFLLLIFIYFLYFIINGSSGFLNMIRLNNELIQLKQKYTSLENNKKFLKIKNRGMYKETLDLDILEEEAKKLGYVNSSEIIVLIDNE